MMNIAFIVFMILVRKVTSSENFELIVLHSNNINFEFEETEKNIGGASRAAYLLSKYRRQAKLGEKPPVLYLNAGDNFAKTSSYSSSQWEMVAEYLNALKPDVLCLGNHDLDVGVNLTQFLKRLATPVVGVNIDLSSRPELKQYIKTSHILKIKDHRIGIIGYTTSRTRIPFLPKRLLIKDEIESVKRESFKLHHMGVKIIIALGHSGYEVDKTIARLVEHIDVIIAGHRTGSIETVPLQNTVKRKDGKYVPIIHEPGNLKYLGMLKIKFDVNGDVINFKAYPIKLHHRIPQAQEVTNIHKRFKRSDLYEPIGTSRVRLSAECSYKECNYANLITDAICDYRAAIYNKKSNVPLWTDYGIVIINSGMIRKEVNPKDRPITRNDFLRSIYYDNTIVLVQIEGRYIIYALEQGVILYGPKNSGLLQFSGLHVVFNMSEKTGDKVKRCFVRCSQCPVPKFELLKPGTIYSIIVNEYLFNGAHGIEVLSRRAKKSQYLNNPLGSILENYVQLYKTISPEEEDRFIITDKSIKSSVIQSFLILTFIILRYL